jgi:dsRNA-specific ribonuclease
MRAFTVAVLLFNKIIGIGKGYSRQSAEQDAANQALTVCGYSKRYAIMNLYHKYKR